MVIPGYPRARKLVNRQLADSYTVAHCEMVLPSADTIYMDCSYNVASNLQGAHTRTLPGHLPFQLLWRLKEEDKEIKGSPGKVGRLSTNFKKHKIKFILKRKKRAKG